MVPKLKVSEIDNHSGVEQFARSLYYEEYFLLESVPEHSRCYVLKNAPSHWTQFDCDYVTHRLWFLMHNNYLHDYTYSYDCAFSLTVEKGEDNSLLIYQTGQSPESLQKVYRDFSEKGYSSAFSAGIAR